jgi:hypothetical protein
MGAKLFYRQQLVAMTREQFVGFGGADSGCAGLVHSGRGGGNAYKSNVLAAWSDRSAYRAAQITFGQNRSELAPTTGK